MDGLLISSEDIYTIAISEVLHLHGHPSLSWDVKVQLQGLPGPVASQKVLDYYEMPYTAEELFQKTSEAQLKLWPTVKFMPGAYELLKYLAEKGVPIALATSSSTDKYYLKTEKLQDGFKYFGDHRVTGDDPRIPPGRGKPFPDIWHIALESLNSERTKNGLDKILIEECLVFEDGAPGVRAGTSAGAHVIWVPDERALQVMSQDVIDDLVGSKREKGTILGSLADFKPAEYGL
ncbi:unnamed protein product [Kuraishia capsulata CBS 1993]|uniref:Uncharacterized protein n=1 Tax=Kuraishia capsulata CBS 1993 TaxID=1382522 RepID=W6MF55_9ASCO|nr:uncharacterized protein KUCA_T00000259001 [Kuraishia capsulata CBS 1993]CDK24299.1 unnamed protein product [Kuraishia capsulata CBS 1993]